MATDALKILLLLVEVLYIILYSIHAYGVFINSFVLNDIF